MINNHGMGTINNPITSIIVPYNNYSSNYIYNQFSNNNTISDIHENDETKQWQCKSCGLLNNIDNKCCNQPYTWECLICEHENESHLIVCEECSNTHTWTCESCDNENLVSTHTCNQCLNINEDLIKWTCSVCNETKELTSRFKCGTCYDSRICQCNECISNMLYIPFVVSELMDFEIDYTELEDVEINNGLTEEQINNIPKVEWTSEMDTTLCSICIHNYEVDEELYILPCNKNHLFHKHCLNCWFERHDTCPMCRFKIE